MRKITAIFLLAAMVFNCGGYRVLTAWLQHRADCNLQQAIDRNLVNLDHLIEVSLDINLPYTTNWGAWEKVTGSVEVAGKPYNFVERKIENGRVIYRCLPNTEKQEILNSREAFAKLVSNFNAAQNSPLKKAPVTVKLALGDYDHLRNQYSIIKPEGWVIHLEAPTDQLLRHGFNTLPWRPPCV